MLVLQRRRNESITIDDRIKVTITQINGKTVKVGIEAPPEVNIVRTELINAQQDNQECQK